MAVAIAAGGVSPGCDADARVGDEVLEEAGAGWAGKRGGTGGWGGKVDYDDGDDEYHDV